MTYLDPCIIRQHVQPLKNNYFKACSGTWCSWFHLLVYVIIFDDPSVDIKIICFLSCQPIQSNLFFLNATVSPLANFFLTPNNNYSAKGTAVYQLSVKRWYPWPSKGTISSIQMSCEISYSLLELCLPS